MAGNESLIQEIAAGLRNSKGQLEMVMAQLTQLQRQKQLAQVTAKELGSYPVDQVWRSCGKMFLVESKTDYTQQLDADAKTIEEQIKALEVKKHYLETTVQNSIEALKKAVQR
ncbi:AaceriAEL139Wp [[Ashbya] aceris (nom. inval.)]|nr:AaceriAEL139Wp [[Ashbya] aceris (nom. inval.)]